MDNGAQFIYKAHFGYRTNIGRARAWLRLALMQKRLADYMRTLIEKMRGALAEYYGIQSSLC